MMSQRRMRMQLDKSIHFLYDQMPFLTQDLFSPKEYERYGTYYAEDRLYLVFDYLTQATYFTKADSPKDAIKRVKNLDLVYYKPKGMEDADE